MFLYLLTQNDNTGYDTYDSMIVAAPNEEIAKTINVYGFIDCWANSAETVICKKIGVADGDVEQGVVLASFNAG